MGYWKINLETRENSAVRGTSEDFVGAGRGRLAKGVGGCIEDAFFRIALAAEPPLGERREIVGDGFDGRAQFERGKPAIGDRCGSGGSAEKISGDRARRITVSTVIYSENDSVFKISRAERAIYPHRQSFLGHEPFSKLAQGAAFARARLHQAFGFLEGGQRFVMGGVFAELFLCRVNCVRE